jgi:hypothetical protein
LQSAPARSPTPGLRLQRISNGKVGSKASLVCQCMRGNVWRVTLQAVDGVQAPHDVSVIKDAGSRDHRRYYFGTEKR